MTEFLSDAELARGVELAEAATPGPWEASPYSRGNPSDGPTLHTIRSTSDVGDERVKYQIAETDYDEMGYHDAEFIAFARTALPRALAEVRAAREREAAGYDVYQPVYQMADGSFGFGDDMECPTRELAEYHVHRDSPWDFVVRQRRGPWEPVTGGDDDAVS